MATADLTRSALAGSLSDSGALLQRNLQSLARRRNAQIMARALVRAAIPGVALAALAVLAYRFFLVDGAWWMPVAMILVALLIGARNGRVAQRGTFAAAVDADQKLQLDDRLSSALSFVAPGQIRHQSSRAPKNWREWLLFHLVGSPLVIHSTPAGAPTNFVPALVEAAAARSASLDPKSLYPFPWNKHTWVLALLTVLLLGFCLMPDIQLFRSAEEKKLAAVMALEGRELVAVAKQVRKNPAPKAEEVNRLSKKLEKLGQQMMRGRMTKRAALTQMGELRKQLQKAQTQTSQYSRQDMAQIAEALKNAPLQSEAGRKAQRDLLDNKWDEAAKLLEQLADKLEKGELSEQEKQKAADDLDRVARELRQRGGKANEEQAQQLENAASQLRQQQNKKSEEQNNPQSQQNQQGQPGQNDRQQQQNGGQQGQQGAQNQQGQQEKQQSGQGQQPGQSGAQQNQGKQGQQQQNQGSQQDGSPQGGSQQGQGQPGSGQNQDGPNQQSSGQGAADALRDMAKGLRNGASNGGNSQNLQEMLDKLRQAENQTGTNGGSQSGMGNAKPGGSSGGGLDGNLKGLTPGKDLMPTDPHEAVGGGPGLGPRNHAGSRSGGGISKFKSNRTGDKRRYADVWSDRLPKTRKQIDRVKGKWGTEGEMEQLPTRGEAKGGPVKTPYYEVYESYKRDAEEAVGRDNVPPAYKQPVKDYFESIKP